MDENDVADIDDEAARRIADRVIEDDKRLCDAYDHHNHFCSLDKDHDGYHICECGEKIVMPEDGADEELPQGGFHGDGEQHTTVTFYMTDRSQLRLYNVAHMTFTPATSFGPASHIVVMRTGRLKVQKRIAVMHEKVSFIEWVVEGPSGQVAVRSASAADALFPDGDINDLIAKLQERPEAATPDDDVERRWKDEGHIG